MLETEKRSKSRFAREIGQGSIIASYFYWGNENRHNVLTFNYQIIELNVKLNIAILLIAHRKTDENSIRIVVVNLLANKLLEENQTIIDRQIQQ